MNGTLVESDQTTSACWEASGRGVALLTPVPATVPMQTASPLATRVPSKWRDRVWGDRRALVDGSFILSLSGLIGPVSGMQRNSLLLNVRFGRQLVAGTTRGS